MSTPQNAQAAQPNQIHPIAELHETLFQLGIIRNRNLILATENVLLKERVQQLESEVDALTAPALSGEQT